MRGDGGPGDEGVRMPPEVPGEVDESGLETPNCPTCLHRMEVAESPEGRLFWECGHCGQVRLG